MLSAPFFAALFFLLISLYILRRSLELKKLQSESESWPSVQGNIEHSELSVAVGNRNGRNYSVEYTYEVAGKQYSHYIPAFYSVTSKEDCEAFAEKYKKGDKVTVYYQASNPQKAVLELGMNGKRINDPIIACSIISVISLAAMIAAFLGLFD
ncbi:DUF3592 domain-containing protein [Glaciecola sp. MH2013]|uniref:DUF3592 domain-containing protein n=1 Tax=Glaciecola sp. MH2013 TaxID=2785524 RepID=UPI00189D1C1D|nr:DUF3592 domain-containing protein [Glaciecola sp. MH2013]MBF7072134.1 DUF3592 domain-containing protein [Glaciecola sp. MH2013]